VPAQIDDLYPLSPMQEGLLFHSLNSPGTGVHLTQHAWVLRALNVDAFTRAWRWVIARHPPLRTVFVWKNTSKPLQAVLRDVPLHITLEDWRGLSDGERRTRLAAYLDHDRRRDFNLSRAPLLRIGLMTLDDDRHQFVLTQHHILLDGWSLPLLSGELGIAYQAYARGAEPSLPAPRPYRDYVQWLQQQSLERADAFWQEMLGDFDGPRVTRSAAQSASEHWSAQEHHARLADEDTTRLKAWCRASRVTVNTAVQAAWGFVLGNLRQSDDVVFGAIVSGRPTELAGVETMLGLFINTIPVRVRVAASDDLVGCLRRLQSQHGEASQYAFTPLPRIKRASRVPAQEPLFDTAINFLNYPRPDPERGETALLDAEAGDYRTSNSYRLSLLVSGDDGALSMTLLTDPEHFPAATVDRIAHLLPSVLSAIASGRHDRVGGLQQHVQDASRDFLASRRSAGFRQFQSARTRAR
jgi:hypothetical protein